MTATQQFLKVTVVCFCVKILICAHAQTKYWTNCLDVEGDVIAMLQTKF